MSRKYLALLTGVALVFIGCKDESASAPPAQAAVTPVQPDNQGSVSVQPTPVVTANNAPPNGLAPAALPTPSDPLDSVKQSKDGSPNKSDLEALQAVVDGYSFGVDGLGAPPISGLEVLVSKGILKKIPTPPPGKKWAYDSAKWKVSLVDQ